MALGGKGRRGKCVNHAAFWGGFALSTMPASEFKGSFAGVEFADIVVDTDGWIDVHSIGVNKLSILFSRLAVACKDEEEYGRIVALLMQTEWIRDEFPLISSDEVNVLATFIYLAKNQ